MLGIAMAAVVLAGSPSMECLTAARRVADFMAAEAKGTRHEKQILDGYAKAGGKDKAIVMIAEKMKQDACMYLMLAPDSTVRALAASMLPERNGK